MTTFKTAFTGFCKAAAILAAKHPPILVDYTRHGYYFHPLQIVILSCIIFADGVTDEIAITLRLALFTLSGHKRPRVKHAERKASSQTQSRLTR